MLAIPFTVALKEKNSDEIAKNEEGDDRTGLAITENIITIPTQKEIDGKMKIITILNPQIGVLWDDTCCPAISYHRPEELVWLDTPTLKEEVDVTAASKEEIADLEEIILDKRKIHDEIVEQIARKTKEYDTKLLESAHIGDPANKNTSETESDEENTVEPLDKTPESASHNENKPLSEGQQGFQT